MMGESPQTAELSREVRNIDMEVILMIPPPSLYPPPTPLPQPTAAPSLRSSAFPLGFGETPAIDYVTCGKARSGPLPPDRVI